MLKKEFKVKSNETLILILSSILTIVLGYNGIKLMVNDILVKIPYIKWYVNMHPLRTTLGIWCFFNFNYDMVKLKKGGK